MAAEGSGQAVVSPVKKRTKRPTRLGVVTSDKRDKTIAVTVSYSVKNPKYGKYIRRRTVLQVHDEENVSKVGDRVEVAECRPVSKTKSWVLLRVLQTAHEPAAAGAAAEEPSQK